MWKQLQVMATQLVPCIQGGGTDIDSVLQAATAVKIEKILQVNDKQ